MIAFLLGLAMLLLKGSGGGVAAPSKGRTERRNTAEAKVRLPDLTRYYKGAVREIEPGAFEFAISLLRGARRKPVNLDEHVESVEWADEGASLTGTLMLRRPDPERPREIPLLAGHRIRCKVRYRGGWYTLWTMRAASPDTDLGEGGMTVELADDLQALRRNRRKWEFRVTKKRKAGWFCHEIARTVCKREGLRVRRLTKGKTRIKKLVQTSHGLDVIREAYMRESKKTGQRYIIRLVENELEVVPYRRNRVLYVFRDQITEALLSAEQKAHPVTVIDARARVGKGRAAKKVKRRIYHRAVVKRFGWVAKEKHYGRVDNAAALEREVKADLAKEIRASRTAEITVPGVPFIRRGDGIRWPNREPGWYGKEVEHSRDRTYVYVRRISHSVSGGQYTSNMTVVQEDPFRRDRERRDREAREKKRREREGKKK